MIKVIQQWAWEQGQNNTADGGLVGLLSLCDMRGVKFWVRENVVKGFEMSSGERWGDKRGATPAKHRQILEVHIDAKISERSMQILRALVRRADAHHRPVHPNKAFNQKWIDHFLKYGNRSDRIFDAKAEALRIPTAKFFHKR